MPDVVFAVLAIIVFLSFSGLSLVLLIRPSLFFRLLPNPLMRDTPWNRPQMRTVGLVLCLFILLVATSGWTGVPKREVLEGFHNNILIALWVSVFAAPVISWILWRFSVDFLVRRGRIDPTREDPAWERGMALTFCFLLSFIVLIAFFLAAGAIILSSREAWALACCSYVGVGHVEVRENAQSVAPAWRRVRATVAAISGAPGVSP
jgi:hypothetical protein